MSSQRTFLLVATLLAGAIATGGCLGETTAVSSDDQPQPSFPADKPDAGGAPLVDPVTQMDMSSAGGGDEGGGGEMGIEPGVKKPIDPNLLPQNDLFVCKDPGQGASSPARLRRLLSVEWTRALGQKFNSEASNNPLQPSAANLYSTYDRGLTLDTATLDQYLGMSKVPLDTLGLEHIGCFRQEGKVPSEECVLNFVTELLERRVYFRPPTKEEIEQLVAFAKENVAKETAGGGDRNDTLARIFRGAWLTTGALFRAELGEDPQPDGRRKLSDWELAKALAYAISDRAPAAPRYISTYGITPEGVLFDIRQAAIKGTISDPDVIKTLVRRHIAGSDPGNMGLDHIYTGKQEDLPQSIRDLSGREKHQAIEAWVGRRDVEHDLNDLRRARQSEYWMSDKLQGFFREWLDYEDVGSVFKDRAWATSRFDTRGYDANRIRVAYEYLATPSPVEIEPTFAQLLDNVIARVVVQDKDVIRGLMTTREFFVQPSQGGYPALQKGFLFDIDTTMTPIPNSRQERWRTMPKDQRAGVLTHPAWLAAHGDNFENGPSAVHRGKWIRERLLCGSLPDIPIDVDAQLDPETLNESARTRIAQKTGEGTPCYGCHRDMNPLGYTFEIYNHAGYVRAEDHGSAPDGSSTLVNMPRGDNALVEGMPVRDAVEMSQLFGDSTHVKRCVMRHAFRYFIGRDETRADACTLAAMEESYDQSGGSFIHMIATLLSSDTFLYRAHQAE